MADDFSEAFAHPLSLLESALSEPVSLFEVLLNEGSCKGQHNSKIDSHSQKREVVLCPGSTWCHFIQSFPWWYFQSTIRRGAWKVWALRDLSAEHERKVSPEVISGHN